MDRLVNPDQCCPEWGRKKVAAGEGKPPALETLMSEGSDGQ
jgi:hypothetical protein